VLAGAADGDVCNTHVMCEAVFGQVFRIRHSGDEVDSLGYGWATPEWERCIRRSNTSCFWGIVTADKFVTIATM
jgi:hypothetical protein